MLVFVKGGERSKETYLLINLSSLEGIDNSISGIASERGSEAESSRASKSASDFLAIVVVYLYDSQLATHAS